jgi:hypothetical protein
MDTGAFERQNGKLSTSMNLGKMYHRNQSALSLRAHCKDVAQHKCQCKVFEMTLGRLEKLKNNALKKTFSFYIFTIPVCSKVSIRVNTVAQK